jgi:hypothetical protein
MKKVIYFVLAGIVLLGPVSCKKDDPAPATPAPSLPTAPEAKAEHDTKSGGIYKGTFANANASGTIKVVLQDGKTEVVIVYNGVSRTLTTTDLASWASGDAITDAIFTATDWQVLFVADADGTNFAFGLNLAGASDFEGVIFKEVSTAQVRVYEGSFTGDSSGKWNFGTQSNFLVGVYSGSSSGSFEGTITGTDIAIDSGTGLTATGTFTNENSSCSGTWSSSGDTGTWTGTRKL